MTGKQWALAYLGVVTFVTFVVILVGSIALAGPLPFEPRYEREPDPIQEATPSPTATPTPDPEYILTAYGHGCTQPRNGVERPPQPTASGVWPKAGRTIAADWSIHPPGTVLYIPGLGERVVEDNGDFAGFQIDVFMDDCAVAWLSTRWTNGVRVVTVGRPRKIRYAAAP